MEQGIINGTINFLTYDNYKNFVDFVESSNMLKFLYKIPFKSGQVEYYKDVQIQELTKTEIQTTGVISESITFDCLSLWYEQNETILQIDSTENERRWNFRNNARYISYNNRSIIFNNKGHVPAPFQIEIDGYVENPSISIFIDKEIYANIKIPITIQEYEKFLYSSKTGNIYIQKQNTDGTKENLWKKKYIDITKQNIFKLPLRSFRNKIICR